MVWCLRAASKWQFSTGKDVSEKGSAFCRQWNNCRRSLNWVQEGGRKESPWQVEIFFCSSSILEALVNENDWLENESKLLNLKKKIFFPLLESGFLIWSGRQENFPLHLQRMKSSFRLSVSEKHCIIMHGTPGACVWQAGWGIWFAFETENSENKRWNTFCTKCLIMSFVKQINTRHPPQNPT